MKKGTKPAFPSEVSFENGEMQECFQSDNYKAKYPGISTRLYLAGMAMQGIVSYDPYCVNAEVARKSLEIADELIKQVEESR